MKPEIINSLQKPDLFEKFKLQMKRDFELCGFSDYTPVFVSNNLQDVFESVLKAVVNLEHKGSSHLMNLLYRIDLTEKQIKSASIQQPNIAFQHLIAELIIKRILQKVIIKEQYSK